MYSIISKPFKIAFILCLAIALPLFLSAYLYSRESVFLWLNGDLGNMGDFSFVSFSLLAEGWMWIPYFILLFGWFKKDHLFILLNFLISTLLTQLPKNLFWDQLSRPMASGIPHDQIHTVKGVTLNMWNSFPSGHTATAFTIYLVTVFFFPKKEIVILGAFYAIACGYSRVYLAQHFPLDVAGGIVVALITVSISIYIRKKDTDVKKIK